MATREHQRRRSVPEPEPGDIRGLADPVRERRSEWSRDDVGHPERSDAVEPEPPPGDRRNQDDCEEEKARGQIAHVERSCGEVSKRGAESEGRKDSGPVERFTSLCGDAVDGQRSLAAIPRPEHGQRG